MATIRECHFDLVFRNANIHGEWINLYCESAHAIYPKILAREQWLKFSIPSIQLRNPDDSTNSTGSSQNFA